MTMDDWRVWALESCYSGELIAHIATETYISNDAKTVCDPTVNHYNVIAHHLNGLDGIKEQMPGTRIVECTFCLNHR